MRRLVWLALFAAGAALGALIDLGLDHLLDVRQP